MFGGVEASSREVSIQVYLRSNGPMIKKSILMQQLYELRVFEFQTVKLFSCFWGSPGA